MSHPETSYIIHPQWEKPEGGSGVKNPPGPLECCCSTPLSGGGPEGRSAAPGPVAPGGSGGLWSGG